jgi:glutathione S-transferase
MPDFHKTLTPLRLTFKKQQFVAGGSPGFSDYIVFGAFQWARCISDFSLLQPDDPIYEWRQQMLRLHDGLAGNAVGYSV